MMQYRDIEIRHAICTIVHEDSKRREGVGAYPILLRGMGTGISAWASGPKKGFHGDRVGPQDTPHPPKQVSENTAIQLYCDPNQVHP